MWPRVGTRREEKDKVDHLILVNLVYDVLLLVDLVYDLLLLVDFVYDLKHLVDLIYVSVLFTRNQYLIL